MRTTRAAGLAAGFVLVAGLSACSGSPGGSDGSASCAAPHFTVTPATVAPGGSVRVHGEYFTNGCADTGENGRAPTPAPAATDLPLRLATGSTPARELTRLDATGPLGTVDATVTLPTDLPPGPVTLHLGDTDPVTLTVTN